MSVGVVFSSGVSSGDVNAFFETFTVPTDIATNDNNASDRSGSGNIFPFTTGQIGIEGNVIPASTLIGVVVADGGSDTGIGDINVTIRWFE